MRGDRGRRQGRGSFVLTMFLLGAWLPGSARTASAQGESPSALVERAARASTKKERDALARRALKVLALEERTDPLLEARAWLLLDEPAQAARALESFPLPPPRGKEESLEVFHETAGLLVEKRDWGRAFSLLARVTTSMGRPPAWALAWFVRAWAGLGRKNRAQEVVTAGVGALKRGWRKGPFLKSFFQALVELDRGGRPGLAVQGFQALEKAFPRQSWAALNLAVALRHACRYREAAAVLAGAGKILPHDPALPTDEGLTWKCMGRMEEAEACFRRGMAAAGPLETRDPRISLGLLLLDRGDKEEAARVMRPTLKLPPPQPYAWLLWVRSAFCCGKRAF